MKKSQKTLSKIKKGHGIPFTPRGGQHRTSKDYHRGQQKRLVKSFIIESQEF